MFNQQKTVKIPKEFTLFGHKYTVLIQSDLFEKEGCYGNADEDLKLIKVQSAGRTVRRHEEDGKTVETEVFITEQTVAETFFHELIHIILDATGEEELSMNEKFVNMMGKSLLEIYLSSVYEQDSKKEV